MGLQPRRHGADAGKELALVVAGAPAVEASVPQRRGKGRRLPLLQGLGRLHVVVAVDQQREGGIVGSDGAIDEGVALTGADLLCRDAGLRQQVDDEIGAGLHSVVLRGDGPLADQLAQAEQVLVLLGFDVAEHRHNVHWRYLPAGRRVVSSPLGTGLPGTSTGRRRGSCALSLRRAVPRRGARRRPTWRSCAQRRCHRPGGR